MVEMDGKPLMSCSAPMSKVQGTEIITLEGLPADLRTLLGRAFVEKGAVQCGFCTPGFLSRTQILLKNNPNPTRRQIIDALRFNLCRCTGYIKIVEAIEYAATLKLKGAQPEVKIHSGKVGTRYPKYEAFETAIGIKPFVCDMKFPGMLYGALKFSDHPRARVIKINITEAEKLEGVVKVFSAKDIPGNKKVGLIVQDWDLMISEGEITRYVGDVIVGIVAISEEVARYAVSLIKIDYEILHPLLNVFEAEKSNIKIHEKGNVLDVCVIKRGLEAETAIKQSDYVVKHQFSTQLIEHGFLEPECAISLPDNGGVKIYSQSQGVYEDQKQIASLLNLPLEKVNVIQVSNGGGFGGKEDMSVQGHSALFAYHLNKPVKVTLSREESIIMHPKRHPIIMNYTVGCDKNGLLTIVAADITGDTGAYASVGMKVLERAAGHSTGAYYVPSVDVIAKTIYTNNLPCGAMRGFGVPQTAFAMEVCIDELCELGGFDRWKFRYDNALTEGKMTTTGQILRAGVGVRKTLEAVKDKFYESKYSGIACGIKNTGVGNGMPDFSIAKIEIKSKDHIIIHHGWTEMGQGVHTMALQTFCQETGISPEFVEVMVDTKYTALSGMTTASRATSLVGNAVIESCKLIKKDLETLSLENLVGKTYVGKWICDWTTKPGMEGEAITHYSYSYATQLVILDDNGKIYKVYAAHDAGKIMNPTLFEGQIEGSISMGLGYALTEDLPLINGKPVSTKLRDCGMYLAKDMPEVEVIGIEVRDPYGPYGAKGVGEIGLVPTAGAVANALYQYDKIRRFKLPLMRKGKKV
ncbi:selenium-dependent xanthine dehydrogenase [bacterium]|nr:MAG: selenium-dependent xanthine dehydrogenase [bacterium]